MCVMCILYTHMYEGSIERICGSWIILYVMILPKYILSIDTYKMEHLKKKERRRQKCYGFRVF